jgi:hypothetical protein
MVMSKGFAPSNPAEKSEELNKPKPISLEDLQTGFSNYFDDVPDPRVERTKQHLLKDILVIALFSGHSRSEWVGRHGKLWNQ